MTASSRSSSRPAGRLFVLLVLAVLAGVLGMHGLAPAGCRRRSGQWRSTP
ncbi:DUF6153 family protein [Streptomyces thermocarboxydus]